MSSLLDALLLQWPTFDEGFSSKEQLFAKLYPGDAYADKKWRYALSELCRLVEAFWIAQNYETDEYRSAIDRMEVFAARKAEKAYRHALRHATKLEQNATFRDVNFFQFAYQSHEHQHRLFTKKRLRQHDASLQLASDYLDRFYYLEKLRFACAMLERKHVLQTEFREGISTSWLKYLEECSFFGEPLIQLYHLALQMQLHEDEPKYFTALREALSQSDKEVPEDDRQSLYQMAINYCARKIRKGASAYTEEALQLYQQGIATGVLLNDGVLSPWTFTNVVKLALRLRQFSWLESFIESSHDLLEPSVRGNALRYNTAELYFYTNRLKEAQIELLQVEMSDLNYYLGARVLLAKIYMETGEDEALLSLLAAFTVFLKRNKEISNDLKQTYLNFCQILWQIMRAKEGKKHSIEPLISNTALLTDRSWLLDQARKVTST